MLASWPAVISLALVSVHLQALRASAVKVWKWLDALRDEHLRLPVVEVVAGRKEVEEYEARLLVREYGVLSVKENEGDKQRQMRYEWKGRESLDDMCPSRAYGIRTSHGGRNRLADHSPAAD